MKPVLIENALEAWAAAIRYCNDIISGKATLQYQKNFVSSLHNAVELIMKQMLLNNNNHEVAKVCKPKNKADKILLDDYLKATNLNDFFDALSSEDLSKFRTIKFNKLISLHQDLFGHTFTGESLERELKILQQRRNDETHFLISHGSFLSEEDFCMLHNFMIRFYKIMEEWLPNKDDYGKTYILPYWGEPNGAYSIYAFNRELLDSFSYKTAVKNSDLAKEIAELLNSDYTYGAPNFSSYDIAKNLIEVNTELSYRFNELWEMVHMMQCLGMIVVDEILDDEQDLVYYETSVLI